MEPGIYVAGVKIGEEHFPILYKIMLNRPASLAGQIEALAKASGATNEMAAVNLEVDLQHERNVGVSKEMRSP